MLYVERFCFVYCIDWPSTFNTQSNNTGFRPQQRGKPSAAQLRDNKYDKYSKVYECCSAHGCILVSMTVDPGDI